MLESVRGVIEFAVGKRLKDAKKRSKRIRVKREYADLTSSTSRTESTL
jgi:hypothetical protein